MIYYHNLVTKRGGTFSRPFLETRIFWKLDILKKFIFLVSKYGNMTSIKTHLDRLRNLRKELLNRRFNFFDFGRGWGPHICFRCCLIVALSFFGLLRPRVFKIFLIFALDYHFRVFTLESHFFFHFFIFSFSQFSFFL